MGKPVKSRSIKSLCLLVALVAAALPQGAMAANDSAACTVRFIHAKHEGTAFDPKLEPLRDQLTRPPLSSWKSFSLLGEQKISLHALTPTDFAVPGDHQGRLEFLGTVESNGKQRLRLRWQLLDGAARLMSTVFVIDDGGTVLQAGIKHEQGLLVLGTTCKLGS